MRLVGVDYRETPPVPFYYVDRQTHSQNLNVVLTESLSTSPGYRVDHDGYKIVVEDLDGKGSSRNLFHMRSKKVTDWRGNGIDAFAVNPILDFIENYLQRSEESLNN